MQTTIEVAGKCGYWDCKNQAEVALVQLVDFNGQVKRGAKTCQQCATEKAGAVPYVVRRGQVVIPANTPSWRFIAVPLDSPDWRFTPAPALVVA